MWAHGVCVWGGARLCLTIDLYAVFAFFVSELFVCAHSAIAFMSCKRMLIVCLLYVFECVFFSVDLASTLRPNLVTMAKKKTKQLVFLISAKPKA